MSNKAVQLRRQARDLLAEADRVDSSRQYTRDDLATMTAEQIVEAKANGQLADLLNPEKGTES